jgi:hypothetical protein
MTGDFEGLYKLLDSLDAKECGECLAFFKIEVSSEEEVEEKLRSLIQEYVQLTENDRFYAIFSRKENGIKKTKGKFIFGKRKKTPPWKGYATIDVEEVEEEG